MAAQGLSLLRGSRPADPITDNILVIGTPTIMSIVLDSRFFLLYCFYSIFQKNRKKNAGAMASFSFFFLRAHRVH
jgi:hypothetical protein